MSGSMAHNGSGLGVVALSKNLKLTTTLDRAITQNPCYVPFYSDYDWSTNKKWLFRFCQNRL